MKNEFERHLSDFEINERINRSARTAKLFTVGALATVPTGISETFISDNELIGVPLLALGGLCLCKVVKNYVGIYNYENILHKRNQ